LRKRRTEWTEKKMEEKGSEVGGWRLLKALGAQGGEGKKGGGGLLGPRVGRRCGPTQHGRGGFGLL
jgi:hypothetical protein